MIKQLEYISYMLYKELLSYFIIPILIYFLIIR
jgi:hypothetical protein